MHSKLHGGRWNPPGEFGALYLNATIQVAAANARAQHSGRAIKLFDLLPEARPQVVTFNVPMTDFVDACTSEGIQELQFPENFPFGVSWRPCQAIAREAFANGVAGVAARSNAEASATTFAGEELACFDQRVACSAKNRLRFDEWYPDPIPG
jgi:RES domain-containing protein